MKPKKPKISLMPCMSNKKEKEDKTSRAASTSTVKKIQVTPFKMVTFQSRNNGKQRDVGTHIRYTGDGRNLSLMEIDILRTTGCTWSKIIYPGFKGYLKPQDKDMMFRSPAPADAKVEGFNT